MLSQWQCGNSENYKKQNHRVNLIIQLSLDLFVVWIWIASCQDAIVDIIQHIH